MSNIHLASDLAVWQIEPLHLTHKLIRHEFNWCGIDPAGHWHLRQSENQIYTSSAFTYDVDAPGRAWPSADAVQQGENLHPPGTLSRMSSMLSGSGIAVTITDSWTD